MRSASTCWTGGLHEAAARVIPLAALLPVAAGDHADAGRRLAGRPRRVYRAVARQQDRGATSPEAGRVRLLHPDGHLVAIAEPRAGRRFAGVFCIRAWYWNKISRLGLTHCGGLGSRHRSLCWAARGGKHSWH